MMLTIRRLLAAAVFVTLATPALGAKSPLDVDIDIPYTLFRLDNGLTVIVHEDHKAPVVAFNVWYHVGSKDEQPGHHGFAHLFEHLMFYGSKNFDKNFFSGTEQLGATTQNGTTNWDRTNFFETVPVNSLDSLLWLESDRMANLLGALTQKKLDSQRAVVENEKRQDENRPYGMVGKIQYASIYPPNHPYSWLTIGSEKDLNASSLDDVRHWFKTYYGASNAVVVIAGDVNTADIKKKMTHYFSMVPPGQPVAHQKEWVAKLTGTHLEVSYDRVPQTMILDSWNIQGNSAQDTQYLDMVASILSTGKNSRLYKRLVYDRQLVSSVNAYTATGEIGGTFEVMVKLNPGVDEATVNRIIREELAKFIASGPTKEELNRVKVKTFSDFVRGIERVGGFGGKSDILASNYTYTGDPGFYKTKLDWVRNATPKDLEDAAQRWLADGMYRLTTRPFTAKDAKPSQVDRSQFPPPGPPPKIGFDHFERATLDNGLHVIVDQRHAIPVVRMQLSVDAGFASDQFTTPGVARLAMSMLDEGTSTRNALQISDDLAKLGADLSAGSNLDTSFVSLSTLTTTLDKSLDIFADVILHPTFPAKELPRLRKAQLTRILREQQDTNSMALRVLPRLVYGQGHAYSNPLTGSGTTASVNSIKLDTLRDFHRTWFKPNHATLIVVGDTTMADILPKLRRAFAKWQPG
ncbi:MAG TPA: pitrilysin family protein, partial [Pseudomonadales bacterium]|nr:pitrilysin family protein [Pseudomonadales bacterium]